MNLSIDLIVLYGVIHDIQPHLVQKLFIACVIYCSKFDIKLFETATEIVLEVTDSGVGMNEETRDRMFEKFYQGDTSRQISGNGLGLSLVKKILELHDGRIDYSSIEGVGTTAMIRLSKQ